MTEDGFSLAVCYTSEGAGCPKLNTVEPPSPSTTWLSRMLTHSLVILLSRHPLRTAPSHSRVRTGVSRRFLRLLPRLISDWALMSRLMLSPCRSFSLGKSILHSALHILCGFRNLTSLTHPSLFLLFVVKQCLNRIELEKCHVLLGCLSRLL